MDYKRIYEELIAKARSRDLVGYKERHHVIPRCLGGLDSPDNLINLTAREHFVAHQILVKIYPKVRGLSWALLLMCGKKKYAKSRSYEWAKKIAAKDISDMQKGRMTVMTPARLAAYAARVGIKHTDEAKERMSKAQKGRKVSEASKKIMSEAAKNRPPMAETHKALISERLKGNNYRKGKPSSQTEKDNISKRLMGNTFRRGKPASEETRQKITKGLTGRTPTAETRAKLSAVKRVLSDSQILGVRKDSAETNLTQRQIGARHGISQAEVSRILRNVTHTNIR